MKNDFSKATLMFSMPRSRTQWWAWFFRHEIYSKHDQLSHCVSPEQFAQVVNTALQAAGGGRVFYAETAGIFFHDQLLRLMPGIGVIYNLRNADDVSKSVKRHTGFSARMTIRGQHRKIMHHAYAKSHTHRQHWGAFDLKRAWAYVVGTQPPSDAVLKSWNEHEIDTPIKEQYRDPQKTIQLMRYMEHGN